MSRLAFRRAAEPDVPEILNLLADDALGAARDPVSDVLDPAYRAAFRAIDADPNQALVVAELDGRIIGTLQLTFIPGLSRKGATKALVEAVRIASPLRGRGFGEALMAHAVEMARTRGCTMIQLTTHKSRAGAHRFYARLGFEPTHEGFKRAL